MRQHLLFVAMVLLAACSRKTPEQKLLDEVHPALSSVATLQFAGESWLTDRVPTAFVRRSATAAENALDAATKSLEQSPARTTLREGIRRQLEVAHAAAEQLRQAIENDDRRSVRESIQRITSANAALQRLAQKESR